jgi:diguanylate cyclase (GGDEF)-like protein
MAGEAPQTGKAHPDVLVVDDSPDVHRLLRARLRAEELNLHSALSGREGLELARSLLPALVLLDLEMPGMDGFEVIRRLKDDSSTHETPIIVLSGLQSPQDKVTAFDLGAVDYITKPFDLMELRVRVRSALRIHSLLEMLAQRANIDGLTGLWNRAHFDSRWVEEVAEAARYGRALSLVMIDIDHFKSLNDNYGHPAGDVVLEGFAQIMQSGHRQSDIPCRYGGEEFAIIMPGTRPADALALCERIRESLAHICWPRHPERSCTASFGIAGADGTVSTTATQWLEAADRALYQSKQNGRNRATLIDLSGQAVLSRAG